jgi:SAM-dependent methyltransferase
MPKKRSGLRAFLKGLPGAHAILRRRASRETDERFRREFESFAKLTDSAQDAERLALQWEDRYPCLDDRTSDTSFDRHYIYHTAWAARAVAELHPSEHVDIGSSLYFCSIVSAFVATRFYDYRPADLQLSQLVSGRADLLRLPFGTNSIPSLSCMHVVEHVGLGRYGDPLDPEGDRKAMSELARVISPGGSLLFVVPVGRPRVCFNAHRIYNFAQVCAAFGELALKEFALIPDDVAAGGLIKNPDPTLTDAQSYGCGCFWFRKPLP